MTQDYVLGGLAFALIATTLSTAALGAYHLGQMIRHRSPGRTLFVVLWPTNAKLTDQGRAHRIRALSYSGVAAFLIASTTFMGWLIGPL